MPVRERLLEGNLPLSEVPPSDSLMKCWRISECKDRKNLKNGLVQNLTPQVPEGTVADI